MHNMIAKYFEFFKDLSKSIQVLKNGIYIVQQCSTSWIQIELARYASQ